MKLNITWSLASKMLILSRALCTVFSEDGIPIILLAADKIVEMDPKTDTWLPDSFLRESLKEKCKVCSPASPNSGRDNGIGRPVRRSSTCAEDGTCLLRLGHIGFRPGSACGGDWHLLPGDTDVQVNILMFRTILPDVINVSSTSVLSCINPSGLSRILRVSKSRLWLCNLPIFYMRVLLPGR